MKIFKDIEQGSEDWHRIKWGKIGGTRASGLFVKSDNLLLELLSEITEEFQLDDDGFISPAMLRGQDLEPLALSEASEYIGINFESVGWLEREDNPLLGISPDGLSECERFSIEIKCPESKKHIKTILLNDVPDDNIDQCVHYFTVNDKLEAHYFVSFRPEAIKKIFVKKLTRESFVNIGTKAKPIMKSINEVVAMSKLEADLLQKEINKKIEILQF
ncbi:MAG TPA: YqaJ viral recombinase family protein [Spirochaetota bacterium]|nr:YqaJ viral recombinase family protein [Spirochaetota bacterium]